MLYVEICGFLLLITSMNKTIALAMTATMLAVSPKIDAQHRHIAAHKPPRNPKHGAVAPKHHHKIKIIGSIERRRRPGLHNIRPMSLCFQPCANFFAQLCSAFMAGLANQKDVAFVLILHKSTIYVIKAFIASPHLACQGRRFII